MTGERNDLPGEPDYAAVEVPNEAERPRDEWSTDERRAFVLRRWMDRGSEGLLNKSRLADQFDVSRNTIYKDLDKVSGFVEDNLGERHGAQTVAVFRRAIDELMDGGEFKKAAKLQNEFSDWLERRGAIEKEPDRAELKSVSADASDLDEETEEMLDEMF